MCSQVEIDISYNAAYTRYEWYDRSYLKVMYDIIYDLTYMCVYDIYIEDIGKRQDSNLQEHVSMPTE